MTRPLTISLDAMGGDHGLKVVVPAALDILNRHPKLNLVLVGDEHQIQRQLEECDYHADDRLTLRHASQVVAMDESPSKALRKKRDSSMRVAINLVKSGEVDACVSAGNTGALMATARYVLKTLPGIDRPAIISSLPSVGGHTHMLDLGANIDSSAEHLYQFAVMGSVLSQSLDQIKQPKVGLLNIGEEEIKGNEQVKQAAKLLSNSDLNYIGFVEGNDIFNGRVDVVVCDGFVGNVSLKTCEGVAKMIANTMKEEFSHSWFTKILGLFALPVLKALKKRIDPRRYNGASLLGLQGIVIKSHGGADALAFANAVEIAIEEVANAIPSRIHKHLETQLLEGESV